MYVKGHPEETLNNTDICKGSTSFIGGSGRGRAPRAPPVIQILLILCSFGENLAKSYVGAPPGSWRPLLGEILDPPLSFLLSFTMVVYENTFIFYIRDS